MLNRPSLDPFVREMIEGELHERDISLHAARTLAARKAAEKALCEIEKDSAIW